MERKSLRVTALVAAAALSPVAAVLAATPTMAASTDVRVSEVYGGGGNTGAPYNHDYVELVNAGTSSVSVAGWSVQYASATGTTWTATALTGSIAPGAHYLVQLAGGTTGAALPTPDATGTANLSATSGKVALVTNGTALTCGSACHAGAGVKDYVGYGSANDSEGSPAPAGSNTTSPQRGSADTDNNAADFTAAAPAPQNSTSGSSCTGTRIHDVQGAGHLSSYSSVTGLPGVVTAKSTTGFWMQDPCPDSNVATSEGILVYTSSAPTVVVGDSVTVSGTVAEFRPGGATGTSNLTTTEITAPSITKVASGVALPAATLVGSGGRVPPGSVIEDDATGNVETSGTFDPATDGIDFWESLEGMRVSIATPQVVGPTKTAYGETPVVPVGSGTRTTRGGIVMTATDPNPERVVLDSSLVAVPAANVGDSYAGTVTGVVDYGFGNFHLKATASPTLVPGAITPEVTTTPTATQLTTATFNVENLDPTDPQTKFDGLAGQIVSNLKSPDLLAIEEIQDNNGATDNGVVAADQTIGKLTAAISAAGGPSYSSRQINPVNDADGGEPGGNIRVVFLFRTDRGLAFVDRGTPSSTTGTAVTGTGTSTHLTISPGRVSPTDAAWDATRKPLAGEFTWNGSTFFAVANHFSSKGGDDPLFGKLQPPTQSSATKRHSQATLVRSFVSSLLGADPNAKVVVMGDLNDYDFSQTADILVGSGATALTDLPRTLITAERYTYVYEGNSQVLDHILVSPGFVAGGYSYDVVHVNSEFSTQQSDHDPQVVRFGS